MFGDYRGYHLYSRLPALMTKVSTTTTHWMERMEWLCKSMPALAGAVYLVLTVNVTFDIVLFSVQNYCNQDICNRIYTSLRHDAHNTLFLLFLRMYILQKYTVSFFCICVSFLLSLLYWWLMYCYFYYPAFCFYHCKYYYCWCFVAILWPHIASRDCCYTILMLPNPHLHYSSSSFEYMPTCPLLIE